MKLFTKILTAILCVLIAVGGALGIAYSTSDTFRQSFNSAFNIEEEIQQEDTADKTTDELKTFSASLDEFEAKIATFENKVTACEDSAISNSATLADVKVELQTLNTDFAALKQDYEINKTENKQALAELRATLNDITARLDVLTLNISNDNLLINGDFRVNQRGKTSYNVGLEFTVDRWQLRSNSCLVTPTDDGLSIENASGSVSYLIQKIDTETSRALLGKTLTATLELLDGTKLVATGVVADEFPSGTIVQFSSSQENKIQFFISFYSSNLTFQINISNGFSGVVKYCKLELGEHATAFNPRAYAEELALCQRFFYSTGKIGSSTMLLKAQSRYDFYQSFIFFPVQMRVNPTITVYGGQNGYVNSLPTRNDDNVRISVTAVSTLGIGNGFLIYSTNGDAVENTQYRLNGYVADAEIY